MSDGITWMGWHEPDRTKTPADKLANALARYAEKRGQSADICLCSTMDGALLPEVKGVQIEPRGYIAKDVFYVGRTDGVR